MASIILFLILNANFTVYAAEKCKSPGRTYFQEKLEIPKVYSESNDGGMSLDGTAVVRLEGNKFYKFDVRTGEEFQYKLPKAKDTSFRGISPNGKYSVLESVSKISIYDITKNPMVRTGQISKDNFKKYGSGDIQSVNNRGEVRYLGYDTVQRESADFRITEHL